MTNTILILMMIMLPSMLFGYCIRWMMDEERIAKEILSNKRKKAEEQRLLKELDY